jgi:hypothetical protein
VVSLGERSEDEAELLVDAEGFREDCSRLSCQVRFEERLSGITVTLARRGLNPGPYRTAPRRRKDDGALSCGLF